MANRVVAIGWMVFLTLALGAGNGRAGETATLTLESDAVVFRQGPAVEKYAPQEVPGLKMVEYRPKTSVTNGQETDVSELLFQTGDGHEIRLTRGQPVAVVRGKARDGSVNWSLVP